jgi:hypothetical protein
MSGGNRAGKPLAQCSYRRKAAGILGQSFKASNFLFEFVYMAHLVFPLVQ